MALLVKIDNNNKNINIYLSFIFHPKNNVFSHEPFRHPLQIASQLIIHKLLSLNELPQTLMSRLCIDSHKTPR